MLLKPSAEGESREEKVARKRLKTRDTDREKEGRRQLKLEIHFWD